MVPCFRRLRIDHLTEKQGRCHFVRQKPINRFILVSGRSAAKATGPCQSSSFDGLSLAAPPLSSGLEPFIPSRRVHLEKSYVHTHSARAPHAHTHKLCRFLKSVSVHHAFALTSALSAGSFALSVAPSLGFEGSATEPPPFVFVTSPFVSALATSTLGVSLT